MVGRTGELCTVDVCVWVCEDSAVLVVKLATTVEDDDDDDDDDELEASVVVAMVDGCVELEVWVEEVPTLVVWVDDWDVCTVVLVEDRLVLVVI